MALLGRDEFGVYVVPFGMVAVLYGILMYIENLLAVWGLDTAYIFRQRDREAPFGPVFLGVLELGRFFPQGFPQRSEQAAPVH